MCDPHINFQKSKNCFNDHKKKKKKKKNKKQDEGWAQDCSNWNIFLKPLFRGNLDRFVNNANLDAIAHTSNGT